MTTIYDALNSLIGITPEDDLLGYIFCFILIIWVISNLFGLLYSLVK